MSKQYKYGIYHQPGRWAKIRKAEINLHDGAIPAYLMEDQSGQQLVVYALRVFLLINTIKPQGAYL